MIKSYCVQNNGDCATCSLVSYGRDCANEPFIPSLRDQAQKRVNSNPKLKAYAATILEELQTEWHWEWVLQSGVDTIVEWAKIIEAESEE